MKLIRLNHCFFLLICLVAAIYLLRRQPNHWRIFKLYLLEFFLVETIGTSMGVFFGKNNHWVYNFQMLIDATFYAYLFNKTYPPGHKSKWYIIGGYFVFLFAFLLETVNSSIGMYHSKSSVVLGVLITLASFGYYFLLMKGKKYINILESPSFWIVNGLFFDVFGNLNMHLFFNSFYSLTPISYLLIGEIILHCFMYSCWIYAFVCQHKHGKSLPGRSH